MKNTGRDLEIYFDDLNEDSQKEFLKAMGMENSNEGNYDVVPIAIISIPEMEEIKKEEIKNNGQFDDIDFGKLVLRFD